MAQGKLGFGYMRLPVLGGDQENIDYAQLNQMVDEFLGNGFTYFDTSFAYHNGKSEGALKKTVVDRYPRDSFTIATKFPTFAVQTEDQVEGIFAQQLQNLGTDYVDYYPRRCMKKLRSPRNEGPGVFVLSRFSSS